MSDGYASLDAHAYVDNSLSPADRAAFEAALRRDTKLRARVDAWEAQNEAIRLAFGAAPRPRHSPGARPPLQREQRRRQRPPRREAPNRGRCAAAPQIAPRLAPSRRGPLAHARRSAPSRSWLRLVSFAGGPVDPRAALMRARRRDAARRLRLRRHASSISSPTTRAPSPPGSAAAFRAGRARSALRRVGLVAARRARRARLGLGRGAGALRGRARRPRRP